MINPIHQFVSFVLQKLAFLAGYLYESCIQDPFILAIVAFGAVAVTGVLLWTRD